MKNRDFSFSEIIKFADVAKSSIIHHLNKLELGGVIQNYYKKSNITKEYSFYTLTDFGKIIITNLINSYNSYYSVLDKTQGEKTVLTSESSERKYIEAG